MAWSYRKLVSRIATTAENHGIAVYAVPENGTSITFAYHGCEVARNPRGLIHCPYGRVMHSDVNAAWRGKAAHKPQDENMHRALRRNEAGQERVGARRLLTPRKKAGRRGGA
ncbi:MAG: zinc ribbon domain-containing protein [Thermofilum sp.]|nr:zinc ribbon domain-containing protein [Thermofilum sp.]